MSQLLFGIIPPITTPFRPDGTIDELCLRAEARYLVEVAGIHGLAVGGSTGEGHTLSTEEVRQITAVVAEEVAGRVPVITGVIANSIDYPMPFLSGVFPIAISSNPIQARPRLRSTVGWSDLK